MVLRTYSQGDGLTQGYMPYIKIVSRKTLSSDSTLPKNKQSDVRQRFSYRNIVYDVQGQYVSYLLCTFEWLVNIQWTIGHW